MSNKLKELLITIPFDDFIVLCFGQERKGCVDIPPVSADVVEWHIKNSKIDTLFKVQRVNQDNIPLTQPILWSYAEWYNSTENYRKQKAWSERERVERRIMDANVKIVAKAYKEFTCMEDNKLAEMMAYSMLKNGKTKSIKMLGVDKLITNECEL